MAIEKTLLDDNFEPLSIAEYAKLDWDKIPEWEQKFLESQCEITDEDWKEMDGFDRYYACDSQGFTDGYLQAFDDAYEANPDRWMDNVLVDGDGGLIIQSDMEETLSKLQENPDLRFSARGDHSIDFNSPDEYPTLQECLVENPRRRADTVKNAPMFFFISALPHRSNEYDRVTGLLEKIEQTYGDDDQPGMQYDGWSENYDDFAHNETQPIYIDESGKDYYYEMFVYDAVKGNKDEAFGLVLDEMYYNFEEYEDTVFYKCENSQDLWDAIESKLPTNDSIGDFDAHEALDELKYDLLLNDVKLGHTLDEDELDFVRTFEESHSVPADRCLDSVYETSKYERIMASMKSGEFPGLDDAMFIKAYREKHGISIDESNVRQSPSQDERE